MKSVENDFRALCHVGKNGGSTIRSSHHLSSTVIGSYQDYTRGILPSSELKGRGGQNAHLMRLYEKLAVIEAKSAAT